MTVLVEDQHIGQPTAFYLFKPLFCFDESFMKTHATSPMRWLPLVKAGMVIAAVCLAGQVLAQAVHKVPDDRAKRPRKHREVQRGPVKPQYYPSNPQPPVPTPQ